MTASVQQLHPTDEARRLLALRRYEILDTPPEQMFDRITAMAARIFKVPIAVISLVDESRIWFKSHHGINVREVGREPGLCASAILQPEPWVLSDAREDTRSTANPLVTGDFGLQFYVGIPLKTQDGFNIGMLCVLDREPHATSEAQLADLKDLAAIVMEQMELRLLARRAIDGAARLAGERETAVELAGLMARESDDRVQNHLELVTGLLRHQSWTIEGSQCAAQLTMAANRVAAISRADQYISAAAGAERVNAAEYLSDLCSDLWQVLGTECVKALSVDGELRLSPRQLVAVGLIVNELIANAVRHGAEHIKIVLEEQPEGHSLSVSDDGSGLPENFDPAASGGLGMKIVLAQVQQLKGQVVAGHGDGASGAKFTITFPAAAPR